MLKITLKSSEINLASVLIDRRDIFFDNNAEFKSQMQLLS